MSGETKDDISGWTTDSLRAFMLDKFTSEHAWVELQFVHAREMRIALEAMNAQRDDAQDQAVAAARAAAEQADIKAVAAYEKRLDGMNEFRASNNDTISRMFPREEANQRLGAVEKELNEVKKVVSDQTARTGGQSSGWDLLGRILPIIIAALALYLSLKNQTSPVTLK